VRTANSFLFVLTFRGRSARCRASKLRAKALNILCAWLRPSKARFGTSSHARMPINACGLHSNLTTETLTVGSHWPCPMRARWGTSPAASSDCTPGVESMVWSSTLAKGVATSSHDLVPMGLIGITFCTKLQLHTAVHEVSALHRVASKPLVPCATPHASTQGAALGVH